MRTCSPAEFAARWPGSLHPIVFASPGPALPDDARHLLAEFGLPREIVIRCYNDITLRFGGEARPLAAIWGRDLGLGKQLGDMPGDWDRFWHLADQEFLQGGGWLCIEEVSARLVIIDLDLPDPIYPVSSGIRDFYTTLAHFLDWSEKTDGTPSETAAIRDALLRQDCIPVEELAPFWLNFLDATLDGDPIQLSVSLRPGNAP